MRKLKIRGCGSDNCFVTGNGAGEGLGLSFANYTVKRFGDGFNGSGNGNGSGNSSHGFDLVNDVITGDGASPDGVDPVELPFASESFNFRVQTKIGETLEAEIIFNYLRSKKCLT